MSGFTRVVLAAATIAALGAQPAAADTSAPPEAKPLVEKKDKLVCENARPTGTRMAKRRCRTKGETDRHIEASRRKLENIASRQMTPRTHQPGL